MSNDPSGLARKCPEIDPILKAIEKGREILLTTHARCDGDAIGSVLSMSRFLRANGKTVEMAVDDAVSAQYVFLPGTKDVKVGRQAVTGRHDLVIALDSANLERLEGIAAALRRDVPLINVDHHGSNSRFGSINWVDPGSASVGEMVYDIICAAGGEIDHDIALGLYVSIMTDTGRFSFSNTTPRSHRLAAALIEYGLKPAEIARRVYADKTLGEMRLNVECLATMKFSPDGRVAWAKLTREMYRRTGSTPRDSQEYVEAVKSIHGVDMAILLRETEKPGIVKVSFRATDPLNAAEAAALFGGGGHTRSSGATLEGDADGVESRVVQAVMQYVRERLNTKIGA